MKFSLRTSTIKKDGERVRYAVVGLGHIVQAAVLPAFDHAENAELVALVSGDAKKLEELGDRYRVERRASYDEFDALCASDAIDAVYIATPNDRHADFAIRAAAKGVHVLCEKPLAPSSEACRAIADAARENEIKLMVAYRLHFERTNLEAIAIANSDEIGEPRLIQSLFTMDVKSDDIRLSPTGSGGGTLYDIGIYCINAARSIFRDEPEEVFATSVFGTDPRFKDADEMSSVTLRFPRGRLAAFSTSFGAADQSQYTVVGSKGVLRVDPAYHYAEPLAYELITDGKSKKRTFDRRDQFAAELVYFSRCVLDDLDPEPNAFEGLADVRVIEAAYASARKREPIVLPPFARGEHPDLTQEIHRPPVKREPKQVHASGPRR